MKYVIFILFCLYWLPVARAQIKTDSITSKKTLVLKQQDTARVYAGETGPVQNFDRDTIVETPNDFSPLDIGSNRGIFILSANKMLQLRILGSVRSSFHYGDDDLESKNTFNPYDIPTGISYFTPNFYAGFNQTRLGFEVTRRTQTRGDIFVRLEGDFNNGSGGFRIRHAYGEIGRFLAGKTWSLTNNVGYQPAMVSQDGAVGAIGIRTPQVRYSHKIDESFGFSFAVEYSEPQIRIPVEVNASVIQVIPDLTTRFTYNSNRLSLRFSGAFTTISGRVRGNEIEYTQGYLVSLAGKISSLKGGDLFFSVSTGDATSHFMDVFNGKNIDVVYNPVAGTFNSMSYWGGYLAYSHALPRNFSASVAVGLASISNKAFQPDFAFDYGHNALYNVFWDPSEGARLGIEFATGKRVDKDELDGRSNRISLLMYYDF